MEQILTTYYADNAKKLHTVVDLVVNQKFGGVFNKDMSSFYSIANDVMTDIVLNNRYDSTKGDFSGFLYGALVLAFIDDYKYNNRDKRVAKIEIDVNINGEHKKKKVPIQNVSLDEPIGESDNLTIGDTIQSDFNVEEEVFGNKEECYSQKMLQYLSRLSTLQKMVLNLIAAGYSTDDIKRKLHIDQKQYTDCNIAIHAYRNVSVLY